ncbi:MAG: dimethyl sulfoxide reductase anchor subunit family protein [Shimia sp.]
MHPAPSIILFTSASGLGFGYLFFLGLGLPPVTGATAFWAFAAAYVLAVGGLIASTFHLGHPERALKAFTQWRSSWLSREAWAAALTLGVMAAYGAGLVFAGTRIAPLGWLGAAMCLGTVLATSMIYAQIRAVPRWRVWTTPASFLAFSLSGGAILAGQALVAPVLLAVLAGLMWFAWSDGDTRFARASGGLGTATGLGDRGTVRAFEPPHTGTNYLLREMVHVVGRRHARKLRMIALACAAILPGLALVLLPPDWWAFGLALALHAVGLVTARWLFFAEAEHVVGLYYGKRAAG